MRICAVFGCSNSTYHLRKWMSNICNLHNCNYGTSRCICPAPFRLIPFPTEARDPEARLRWIKLVNRKNPDGSSWQPNPKGNSRICSKHFPDGQPTARNPDPVLQMGYTPLLIAQVTTVKRPLLYVQDNPVLAKRPRMAENDRQSVATSSRANHCDHNYTSKCMCQENCACMGCCLKQKEINKLMEKVAVLEKQVATLQCQLKPIC